MKKNRHIYIILFTCLLIYSCKKDPEKINCYPGMVRMDTAVFLVLGQSNAANAGESRYTASCANAISFYQGSYYLLADPLNGANGDGGSVWSRLGDILVQHGFASVVIMAPAAVGGTTIQQWKPGGVLNHLITETIAQLQAKGLTVTHVLWHQGESNNSSLYPASTAEENAQQYKNDFLELVGQLRSLGVNAPVFPAVATRCGSITTDLVLGQAQRELANDSLGIYKGPNTDLLGNEYRYDDCHFNDLGLKIHALLWADILFAH